MKAKINEKQTQALFDRIWELLLKERGRNQLRGRWIRDREHLRIGLEYEAVGDTPPGPMLWLTIGDNLADCSFPIQQQIFRASEAESLERWIAIACRMVRQREAYVRTCEDRAEYKSYNP
jgi:hypothetical protein